MSIFDFVGSLGQTITGVLDKFLPDKMSEAEKAELENQIKLAISKDVADHEKRLIDLQTHRSGNAWVDGIRALVRPLIAVTFLFLFVADKFALLQFNFTDYDKNIFAGIVSFYFLLRTGEKMYFARKNKNN